MKEKLTVKIAVEPDNIWKLQIDIIREEKEGHCFIVTKCIIIGDP